MSDARRWLDSQLLVHDFPLRPDLQVRLYLPVDLTIDEAERLATIVRSLAFDQPSPSEEQQ